MAKNAKNGKSAGAKAPATAPKAESQEVQTPKTPAPTLVIPEDVCVIDGAVFDKSDPKSVEAHSHGDFKALEELVSATLEAYVAFEKSFAKRFRTGAREKSALENAIAMMEARGASESVLAAMKRELELANIEGTKPRGLAFERRRTLFRVSKLLAKHNAAEASRVRGSMNEVDSPTDPAVSGSPDAGDGEE